jgi:membrane protease YdiL (CAAX protease family)
MNAKDESPAPPDPLHDESASGFSDSSAQANLPNSGEPPVPLATPGHEIQRTYPPDLPKDLRVPWNWVDLLFFVGFYFLSMFAVVVIAGFAFAAAGVPLARMRASGPDQAFFVVIVQAVQSVIVFGYFVAQMHRSFGMPFWTTIGWRPLETGKMLCGPVYLGLLLSGFSLSLAVQLAAKFAGTKAKLPIENLFQDPRSILLLGVMAVTIAPLVEETIFRGYIYPVLARSFGVGFGVVVTGVLFGLLHAQQLWGGWVQIGLLMVVGVIFTFARAVSRTVVASYLLHVSYNLLPSLAAFVEYFGLHHRGSAH